MLKMLIGLLKFTNIISNRSNRWPRELRKLLRKTLWHYRAVSKNCCKNIIVINEISKARDLTQYRKKLHE